MSSAPDDPPRVLRRAAGCVSALALAAVAGCAAAGPEPAGTADRPPVTATVRAPDMRPRPPLTGRVVVLDPGHQLGNASFPAEIDAPVDAGGFTKACNTTGTSTDAGYPEATFAWEVAQRVRRLLERLGARVVLTRRSDAEDRWGPCIDERGRAGNPGAPGPTADVKVSIHADGSYAAGARGFHVIAPEERAPWTTDVAAVSLRLARGLRDALVAEGFTPSTYAGLAGVDVRGDLGTLNLSDVPVVMVELGNMRDDRDAALMTSEAGRRRYARALSSGISRFLARS